MMVGTVQRSIIAAQRPTEYPTESYAAVARVYRENPVFIVSLLTPGLWQCLVCPRFVSDFAFDNDLDAHICI